jgi:hypothetical protein
MSQNKQIALRWSHDQKTQRPTTKSSIQTNPIEREIKEDQNPGGRMG